MNLVTIEFWIIFNAIVLGVLWFDLHFLQKKGHAMSIKEATFWSLFWIAVALLFGAGIYKFMGPDAAAKYITGYVIEKSLSVDNLFVFLMIFSHFQVPDKYQPRILHWGILGALVMRFVLIFCGIAMLNRFHWLMYAFGALLLYTSAKILFKEEDEKFDPESNFTLRLFKKFMPVSMQGYKDQSFFVRENGILKATPLFVVLILIESSDLIFAVDSIPAVLAVSRDPFIVYTSNVFAILGLRALYFLLSGIMPLFYYLKYGISIILAYVGIKMILSAFYHIPTLWSLVLILSILGLSVLASILFPKREISHES